MNITISGNNSSNDPSGNPAFTSTPTSRAIVGVDGVTKVIEIDADDNIILNGVIDLNEP